MWDRVLNIDATQYELFLKAKRYISDNNGTQYADEENNIVIAFLLTKARYEATSVVFNNLTFEYRLQILTKDNKIRVIIDNVKCAEKKYNGLPASTTYPGAEYNLEMDKFYAVMKDLRYVLNNEIINIETEIKKPLIEIDNDW